MKYYNSKLLYINNDYASIHIDIIPLRYSSVIEYRRCKLEGYKYISIKLFGYVYFSINFYKQL